MALVRNRAKAKTIFDNVSNFKLKFIVQDITKTLKTRDKVDFIIHTANTTSSKEYVEKPVETINSIVDGTRNILEFAKNKNVRGVVYLSSMEVYGENDFDREEPLKEDDYGYINLLKTRNSYPEGKRLVENMCHGYSEEYNVPVKIARLCQTIGAGVDLEDKRVFAQFARNVVKGEDIVLCTEGEATRSYCYITDAVSAIFALLEKGHNVVAYDNLSLGRLDNLSSALKNPNFKFIKGDILNKKIGL